MHTSSPSVASYQSELAAANIRQLCQSQIDRLSEKLSALDVWLIRWNYVESKRDTLSYRRHQLINQEINEMTPYIESERWISKKMPFLELIPLSLNSSETFAYVYGLCQTETQCDYLLLWTKKYISDPQQRLIEECAQFLHQSLDLYQENLRQQEKIQLLEQALQRADHQLRNPLALIHLYAKTIAFSAESASQKTQAECICCTTESLSKNLGDLLNCSRQACLNKQDYELHLLLQNIVSLLNPQIEQKQLTVKCSAPSITIAVDSWQFEQVLQNLLDNAIHFSPVGGTITVDWQVSNGSVWITVSDQGPGLKGIDPSELFTPFYSRRSEGSGLGLAIAKKIILDHQGSIKAETLPQGGAQFSIFLPR